MSQLSLEPIHASWHTTICTSLEQMEPHYKDFLTQNTSWLPGSKKIFNAFSLPLNKVRYVLLGESPYPRSESANGYAFWDARVNSLWSDRGLSTEVNRATSLRNFIKMLLVAEDYLSVNDTSQAAIAQLDKTTLQPTCRSLFQTMMQRGILLLNASLVLSERTVRLDAKAWQPFMQQVLIALSQQNNVQLLLFGKIAEQIERFPSIASMQQLKAEHPYNLSFIHNQAVRSLFASLRLLAR